MGWDVAVEGTLALKGARAGAALRKEAFVVAHELGGAPHPFDAPIHVPPKTVGEAIDALGDEAFTMQAKGARLAISGVWAEDTFRDHAATLASVLSIAARHGAKGEVKVVALSGPSLAYRLALDAGGVSVVRLSESAFEALANEPWVADVVERAAAVLGSPPVAETKSASAAIDAALAILATLDDAALFACASDLPPGVSVRMKGRPVDQAWVVPIEAYPDGASLRAALFAKPKKGKASPDDWRRSFALPALAKHDPARAEPLAIALLASDADDALRDSAAHALGHCPTDVAVDALFAALGAGMSVPTALARNAHPSIVSRALAALDDAAIRELYAPTTFPGAYMVTRGGKLVMLLHHRRDPAAAPRLLEVWRQRGRSTAAMLVGSALVTLGTPEMLGEVAEAMRELDVSVAKVGARAFLKIDPATAFERAQPLFASSSPSDGRAAASLLGALDLDGLDPRWLALARSLPEGSLAHRAGAWLLERAKGA